jgi:hypothetical protein
MNPKDIKNLRVFGYGLAVISAFIGWRIGAKHGIGTASYILFFMSAVLTVMTYVNLAWIKKIYVPWMKVAHFIGNVINVILLSLMFFLVFSVVGILLRLMRKDLLGRSLDQNARSYWIKREIIPFDQKRYTQQF